MESTLSGDADRPGAASSEAVSIEGLGATVRQLMRQAKHERGLTIGKLVTTTGVAQSTIYAAQAGKSLPRADTLEAILKALKVPADEVRRLTAARDALDEQRRARAHQQPDQDGDPAGSTGSSTSTPGPIPELPPPPPAPTRSVSGRPHRPRRWAWIAAAAAVVIGVAVVGAVVGVGAWRGSSDPFPRLVLAAAPSARHRPATGSPCTAQTTWRYRFDDNYRGEVYVQLAPTAPPAITVAVTLTWGAVRWRGTIPVQPGALADRQGGTLLRFIKKDNLRSNPADWNPAVNLDSSVPVCAVFGTADTRPLPAPITVVETPGWTPN